MLQIIPRVILKITTHHTQRNSHYAHKLDHTSHAHDPGFIFYKYITHIMALIKSVVNMHSMVFRIQLQFMISCMDTHVFESVIVVLEHQQYFNIVLRACGWVLAHKIEKNRHHVQ